ncbi:hypothetical protein AB1Y20_008467 [Prymnesium parvum]|uniref:ubiquitinyl hydrolase 1 n=1 Tax=Prymnesium parvum TaxID=97485 RepID=A0AB34IR66_PRYPA
MPPVWRERMFSSIFLEPYLDDVDSEQPPPPIGEAIDFVHDLLRQLCADYPMDTALRSIAELCADAEKLHPLRFDSLGSSRTLDFLSAFIQRVQRLRVGDVMLTPGCWSACSGTLFVLGRPSRSSNSDYTLAVCCTGSGAKYHPTHPCLLDGRMQRAVTLWLHGLAAERVCDSSFWFALFHTISTIQTQPQLSWSLLYERVLPYVAQRPLSDFFPSTAGQSTTASSGDASRANKPRVRPPHRINRRTHLGLASEFARQRSTCRFHAAMANAPRIGPPSQLRRSRRSAACSVADAGARHTSTAGEHRNPDAERMELLVRFQMLRRVSADLSSASELPRSEQLFIKGSVSQLVNSLGNGLRSRDWPLRISKATMEDMLSVASEVYQKLDLYDISLPPLLQLGKLYAVDQWPAAGATSSSCLPSGADIFPFFESLRRDAQAIEAAAGVAARLPIVRPVQFTAVPESVWSFEGACDALRQCVAVCTSLSNQAAQIKNSYGLRLTLISHLFTRVLPVPLPVSDSQRATRCLWANEKTPMRAEVQVELISNLSALSAHFAAVSLALAPSRQLDSLRVLTATAIAVIADSVLRIRAVVSPSTLSMHYAGLASGPLHPFGFNAAELLKKETATISLTDPSLALTRAALLEYFYSQRHWLRADHTLFSFERTMSFGEADALFVEQLALQVGLPSAGPLLPRYFSGEEPDLIDQLPELAMLRDIVFLFKAVLCPSADALPEPRAWKPRDAKLRWEHAADKGFSVRGFGDSPLKCCAYIAGAQERGFIKWTAGVASWFGRTERPRVPPSDSDPTTAVRRLGSEKEHRECVLNSEEDVLHVRALPDFEGRLGGHACELLLSYMTVPYLRIPLVLQLLSHSSRLPALASPDLQSIVDAILFEPGEWCTSEEIVSPERVPVGAGSALPTSCGLLFNELAHSPGVVLRAICEMLDGTLELDVGFFDPRGPSVAIMYALRLAVRVEEYAQYLERLTHNSADAERQLPAGKAPFAYPGERPAKVGSGGAPELSGLARVLGERLSISAQARAELVQGRLSIREKLDGTVVSMLRGWFSRAVREQQVEIACTVRAHLAYLHRNEVAGDLDRRAVATILVSQVFLSTNFEGFASLEPSTAERRQTSDAEANERSGSHGLLIDALEMHQLFQRHRASVLEWLESESESTTGAKSEGSLTSQVLEALMHVVSNGVNAGQAELTLTEHHLNPRPVDVVARQWVRMGGDANRGRFVPAAEEDLRLKREIGLLVEQYTTSGSFEEWLWQTTTAAADTEVNAQTGEFTLRRNQVQLLSDKVQRNPDFVAATSEVFGKLPGRRRLHCAQLSHTQHRHWVRLVGTEFDVQVESSSSFPSPLSMWNWVTSVLSGVPAWAEQLLRHAKELLPGVSLSLVAQSEEFGWVRATCLDDETHKEVVLFRLGVVHIFVNEEFGRHPQRRLIYTSNSRLSLHIPRPTQQCRLEGCDDRLQCGDPSLPAVVDESVVVKKRLGPERLQTPLDRLRELVLRMEDLSHVLVWSLDEPSTSAPEDSVADDGDDDIRSSLERRSEHSTRLRSSSSLSDVRANAAPASAASIGAQTSASYGANEKDDTAMDSDPVEPRDGWRLYSEEHPTLFISDHRGPLVESHLRGLPHAVLLQDELGSFFVLLPATAKPFFLTHATRAGGRDRSLVLHRGDKQLLSSLGAVRHHLCPIHPSGAFMTTPTLAAALHLLLMRLLHAQYPEAVALAPVCAHDGELSLEERRIFQNLELTNFDSNPDAHALRLHISLAARDTAFAELCPWNIATELQAYVLKFIHVSAACRVPLRGELVLLRTLDHPTQRLVQRATLVQAILAVSSAEDQGSQRASGYLMPAPPPSSSEACFVGQFFDVHRKPKGASSSDGFSYQEKTWTDWLPEKCLHLYSPPPSGVGLPALEYFNRVLSGSLSLSQHFLLLYELLTGCIDTRPLSTDNTHNWGAMLVWMLSPADAASESLFMETLRLLLRSPHLCRRAPRYEREHVKEQRSIVQQIRTYVLGSGDVKDRFLEAVRALQLHEHTAEDGESESAVDDGPQSSSTFRPTIIARKRPAMRMELAKGYDAPAFLPVPETRLLTVARGEDFRNDTVQLRVVHHLNQAMKLSEKELQALTGCLLQLTAERAVTHLTRSERGLTPLPSDLPFDMRQHPMFEAQVAQRTFKRLSDDVAFFAAEQNHATVPRLTWLAEDVISSLLRRSLLSILRADMGFISRGSPEIVKFANDADLPRKREKGYEEDLEQPRLLLFEFNCGIILREEQVRLVGKFVNSLRRGEPLCHQMIMGAGKTTVIAPLLALLLADGSTLVLQVVPASLVHFSRAVFWRAFSGMTMPKPVFTFLCDRSTQILPSLLASLERARDSSGVVLAAPTALKSFALKFLELTRDYAQVPKTNRRSGLSLSGIQRILGPGRLFGDADSIKAEYEQQLFLCSRILRVMNTGALMLDEVDWVLHPLKSELNWPLGEREPLDFSKSSVGSGLRWKLPFQMIDTILLAAEGATTADPEMPISKESQACIEALENAFAYGRDRHELQDVPHFLLLQRRFYDDSLLPVLARWSAEWLVQMGVQQVDREMLLTYLSSAARDELPKAAVDSMRRALQDEQFKLINLCHNWLHSLLPHVLSKRNRVAYGLLLPHNLSTGTSEPLARKLLAVPFVGKDCPSDSSQFSHPDVVIGLTVLAYRYEGLRFSDFKQLLKKLKDKLNDQLGPYKHRGASITFCKWVAAVGLQVRGAAIQDNSRGRRSTASARYSYGDNVGANASSAENSFEVPPLHLVDLDDVEQMNQLYHSLRLLPLLIHQYLNDTVFPSTMAFPSLKLSASGQELGGDLLFGMRLGFSGTLSDLLPEELGHCHFERGDDARMLHVLTDASVMSHEVLDAGWDARSILRRAATAEPPLHALIDTGALVSGFTNVEAARFLLQEGLRGMQACVFLDESGQKMVLMRDGLKLLRLDRCGVGVENRFTFFDHIHTTGTDVEQPPHARSALTLSKDVTFRDLAQGAFRMRGIGAGQTVLLFMPPGVLQLLREQAALGSGDTLEGREQWLRRLSDFDQRSQLLRDMCAWAVMNSVSSEQVQLRLLCQQSQRNVWRKAAFRRLLADVGAAASANAPTGSAEHSRLVERTNRLLDVFCERLAHDVLNTIPQLQTVRQQQEREVKLYSDILADCGVELSADDRLTLSILRERAINASLNSQSYTKLAVAERDFSSEQVQEQEVQQEVEHQQEQMREEEQKVAAPDTFPKERWDREADDVDKWNLADLRNACADSGGAPGPSAFYPAFKLSSSKMKATGTEPLFFPSFMMVSHNWARRNPSAKPRRLKNVSIVLDWVPDTAALLLTTQGLLQTRHELSDAQEARLREAFTMFDRHGNGILDVDDVIQVLRAVDVVLPHTSTSKLSSEIRRSSAREDDSRGAESASKLVGRFLTRPRSLKSLHSSQSLGETSAHLAARGDLKAEQIEDVAAIIRLIDSDKDGQISYDELREALLTHAFYRLSTGRYQVAVSLAEAETIRFALHAQARASGGRLAVAPNSEIALLHEGQLLDSTSGFRSGGSVLASAASGNTDYLGAISRQCWRFINSELDYDPEASSMLLRALQSNSMAERLAVFHALRHCRRRPAVDWKQFSIARLFTTEDEFKILHLRAMLSRTRLQIRQRRLLPSEFVALCDNDNDGIISYSELHSAIRWLGIDLSTEQVCELIDHLDLRPPTDRSPGLLVNHLLKGLPDVEDGADLLDWEEEEDDGSRSARARRIVIPQLPVYASPNAPLVDRGISPLGGLEQAPAVSDATLSHIMAKIKPVSEFEKLWDTVGPFYDLKWDQGILSQLLAAEIAHAHQ